MYLNCVNHGENLTKNLIFKNFEFENIKLKKNKKTICINEYTPNKSHKIFLYFHSNLKSV
jgi:hypothetical protein